MEFRFTWLLSCRSAVIKAGRQTKRHRPTDRQTDRQNTQTRNLTGLLQIYKSHVPYNNYYTIGSCSNRCGLLFWLRTCRCRWLLWKILPLNTVGWFPVIVLLAFVLWRTDA